MIKKKSFILSLSLKKKQDGDCISLSGEADIKIEKQSN